MELFFIILPVFLIFGVGYLGQKKLDFDIPNLSKLYIYILAPFLAFRTFYVNALSIDYLYMVIYLVLLIAALILVVKAFGKILGYTEKETCGMILAGTFMNNGNYGVPVALFVFGAIGLDYAVVLMVMQSMIANTVGIYYAAKGSSRNYDMAGSFKAILKMPIIYGAAVGVLWQLIALPMPEPLFSAIDLVANGAIPVLMLTLGMQLASFSLKRIPVGKVSLALGVKMVISPVIAIGIALILPVDEMLQQIMILMAAMPTAAYVTMLSLQFETEPDLVTSATFFSTVVSLITIPIVLFFLV